MRQINHPIKIIVRAAKLIPPKVAKIQAFNLIPKMIMARPITKRIRQKRKFFIRILMNV